jgi:hypothetical protein
LTCPFLGCQNQPIRGEGVAVAGTAFSLGWLMAQLFDKRRLKIDELFTPPFDPTVQLPLVAELDLTRRRQLALTDLSDLLAAVAAGVPAATVDAVKEAGLAEQVDEAALAARLQDLHQAILDQLVGSDPQISAYQLGLALSDTCWLAKPDGGPEAFIAMFQRGQVASLKAWLASSGDMIATGAAGIVGQSLDNWQDWIEVNTKGITTAWAAQGEAIVRALHIQAMAWYSVLVGDPQTSGGPTMNAWVQASSSVVRAARKVTVAVLRRFWWLILLIAAVVAAVLALVIVTLHGESRVWTSLLWVSGSIGGASLGLQSAVGRALSGVGSEVWVAARGDAAAWNATWLPTVQLSASQRRSLERAGVGLPVMRSNLAAASQPAPKA